MIGRAERAGEHRGGCCRCQLPLMVIPWKWTLLRGGVENRGRYQLFLLPSMLPARRHPAKAPSRRFARCRRCQKLTRHAVTSRNARQFSKFSAPFPLSTPDLFISLGRPPFVIRYLKRVSILITCGLLRVDVSNVERL